MAVKLIIIVFHSVQICAGLSILYLGLYMDWRLGDLRKVCVVEQYQIDCHLSSSYSASISTFNETCKVTICLDICLSYFERGRFIQFPAKRCHRQIAEDSWNNSEAWNGVRNIINIMTVVIMKIYCHPHQTLSLILVPFFLQWEIPPKPAADRGDAENVVPSAGISICRYTKTDHHSQTTTTTLAPKSAPHAS